MKYIFTNGHIVTQGRQCCIFAVSPPREWSRHQVQENCNAIFVSPQVNELNVACHGNVELIFECEKPRYNGINQMGLNPKRRGLLGGVF